MKWRYLLITFLFLGSHQVTSQVVINEICAANGDVNYDPDFFNFSGWVELYNKGNAQVDIGGYYLSDNPAQRTKWKIPSGIVIPANGFRLIWCDEASTALHTNFKLDSDGETLVLSNSGGTEIDRVTFPSQFLNVSWGRTTNGGTVWGHLINPTPGAPNNNATGTDQLANPTFSLKAGRYSGQQSLSMSHAVPGAIIRYTTDGSEPNSASLLYTGPVSVSATSTVKAKAFLQNYIPSKAEVKTFFISEHSFSLPVVSLSMKPAYLDDNVIGIYADGTNGKSGNCTERKVNWNQDWERHAVFEYFDKTGSKFFDHGVDIRIGGACSRNNPQKSFVVKARDKYGKKTIEHSFFQSKDVSRFGGLFLRNSGNDFYYTMFRDALMQTLPVGEMDIDYLAYQPSIVYLNGKYWGIQNIREKVDADYIESNYGIKKDDIDLIETWGNALEGSTQRYNIYLDSLQKIDLSSDDAYQFISRYIDVQEFINYLTAQIYYANTDWPGNNMKFWRQRSNHGKFRWILWDTDFGFALYTDQSFATHPTLNFATATNGPGWPNPPWATLHFRLLLQNPHFRNKFVQTLTTSLGTTFKPERVIGKINAFQNTIKDEMPYHVARWRLSLNNWNWEVERLRAFARDRNAFMYGHIADFFGLTEQVRISSEVYPASSGKVVLNGITSQEPVTEAFYFKGIPFEIAPAPAPGFTFTHYEITKKESTHIPLIGRGDNWKYFDQGVVPSPSWKEESYNDGAWLEGEAELGYGDGDEKTVVSFGPNPSNKYITTYFRKTIQVDDTVGLGGLSGSVLYDDGVVVYLNGEEVYRGNMPGGTISNTTLAIQAIPSETTFFSFMIPRRKIKPGNNVIAVEIHQNDPSSSDISFDLDLGTYRSGEVVQFTTDVPNFSDLANSDVVIKAFYEPVTPREGIVINEFCAQNSVYEDEFGGKDDWIEVYNKGSEPVDLAGFYFTDNLANKTKHRIKSGKPHETVVAPGTYKILWADGEPVQGPLHLNFKLSADGEELGIYQPVGNALIKVEEMRYGPQLPNTSFSRIPDITGPFLLTAKTTPLAANEFEIPTSVEEGEANSLLDVFPNPATSSVKVSAARSISRVKVYNINGQLVRYIDLQSSFETEISLEALPAGLYNFVFSVEDNVVVRRVMIR